MDINEQIALAIQKRLGSGYSVETRVDYDQWSLDNKAAAGLTFVVRNPLVENDPGKAQKEILQALSQLEPLKPYVQFESQTHHMERLARELEAFRDLELALNQSSAGTAVTTIHNKAPEWFRELPKRNEWDVKHALNVKKTDLNVVSIRIDAPKDIDPQVIVKNMEGRKAAILDVLADRVVKYTPAADTPEKKEALKAQVRRLEFTVTSQTSERAHSLQLYLMSPEQLAATKQPGGITPDKAEELGKTNPLVALQNGEDDQDPDKTKPQPHLQKALARAILYAGDGHMDVLPYIAGREDMRRAIGKSLTALKARMANNPDVVKKIDLFLEDPVFKDQSQWHTPVEKQEFVAQPVAFHKENNDASRPYEPGMMIVGIKLPADKLPEIRNQLAALDAPAPADAKAQETAQAINALAQTVGRMAEKITSWVDRMDARAAAGPASAPAAAPAAAAVADELLANTILAAAGADAAGKPAAAVAAMTWAQRTAPAPADEPQPVPPRS